VSDGGYLSVHPVRKSLMVSPRVRSYVGNGEESSTPPPPQASGEPIALPKRRADRPARES